MPIAIWKRIPHSTIAAIALAGAALAASVLRADQWGVTLCVFKATTGLPCFTCGTTRALAALARGEFMVALRVQPLATLASCCLILWGLLDLGRANPLSTGLNSPPFRRVALYGGAALVVLNWFYLIARGV